jgi:hypothetical protein
MSASPDPPRSGIRTVFARRCIVCRRAKTPATPMPTPQRWTLSPSKTH